METEHEFGDWGIFLEETVLVDGRAEVVYNYIKAHANDFLLKSHVYELSEDRPFRVISWKSREEKSQMCRIEILDIAEKACRVRIHLSFDREVNSLSKPPKKNQGQIALANKLQTMMKDVIKTLDGLGRENIAPPFER